MTWRRWLLALVMAVAAVVTPIWWTWGFDCRDVCLQPQWGVLTSLTMIVVWGFLEIAVFVWAVKRSYRWASRKRQVVLIAHEILATLLALALIPIALGAALIVVLGTITGGEVAREGNETWLRVHDYSPRYFRYEGPWVMIEEYGVEKLGLFSPRERPSPSPPPSAQEPSAPESSPPPEPETCQGDCVDSRVLHRAVPRSLYDEKIGIIDEVKPVGEGDIGWVLLDAAAGTRWHAIVILKGDTWRFLAEVPSTRDIAEVTATQDEVVVTVVELDGPPTVLRYDRTAGQWESTNR